MKRLLIDTAKGPGYLLLIAVACVAALYAREAPAQDQSHYSAQATLQRAQVGTYSPRLAPPVRVELGPKPARVRKAPTRLACRENPAEPKTIICEARRAP